MNASMDGMRVLHHQPS
uniref:Uncharacterized protein n=1 Tax=Arundo donax TaxID=35708 RepID=A0A0A9EU48_ARUDO